ncbi:MAG: hypothetical protein KAI63_05080 [Planctomycetes bacterium]|nr:hypothetical protein [Planctomycetota bacterium]
MLGRHTEGVDKRVSREEHLTIDPDLFLKRDNIDKILAAIHKLADNNG